MNTNVTTPTIWSTASFGDAADTSPLDLAALGEHLHLCKGSNGRLFALQCAAETMTGFVTARFVTTLMIFALLISVGSLIL